VRALQCAAEGRKRSGRIIFGEFEGNAIVRRYFTISKAQLIAGYRYEYIGTVLRFSPRGTCTMGRNVGR
jgi:hypothetical protein